MVQGPCLARDCIPISAVLQAAIGIQSAAMQHARDHMHLPPRPLQKQPGNQRAQLVRVQVPVRDHIAADPSRNAARLEVSSCFVVSERRRRRAA